MQFTIPIVTILTGTLAILGMSGMPQKLNGTQSQVSPPKVSLGEVTEARLSIGDRGADNSHNEYFYIRNNTLHVFLADRNNDGGIKKMSKGFSLKIPEFQKQECAPIYREGNLWCKGRDGIYKLSIDKKDHIIVGNWKLELPYPNQLKPNPSVASAAFSLNDKYITYYCTTNNLVEVYNTKDQSLVKNILYPNATKKIDDAWSRCLTAQSGDDIIFYLYRNGRMFVWNSKHEDIHEIKCPWEHNDLSRSEVLNETGYRPFPTKDNIHIIPSAKDGFHVFYKSSSTNSSLVKSNSNNTSSGIYRFHISYDKNEPKKVTELNTKTILHWPDQNGQMVPIESNHNKES